MFFSLFCSLLFLRFLFVIFLILCVYVFLFFCGLFSFYCPYFGVFLLLIVFTINFLLLETRKAHGPNIDLSLKSPCLKFIWWELTHPNAAANCSLDFCTSLIFVFFFVCVVWATCNSTYQNVHSAPNACGQGRCKSTNNFSINVVFSWNPKTPNWFLGIFSWGPQGSKWDPIGPHSQTIGNIDQDVNLIKNKKKGKGKKGKGKGKKGKGKGYNTQQQLLQLQLQPLQHLPQPTTTTTQGEIKR